MASRALTIWRGESAGRLDELVDAHERIGGTKRGRRYATQQINASLIVQLAAHFQLFCRDLHTEVADVLTAAAPEGYRPMLAITLTERRGLDRANASGDVINKDFARFDLDIWAEAGSATTRTAGRRLRLQQLTIWRNAIAHQDFSFTPRQRKILAGTTITLPCLRNWRSACNGLAQTFDQVLEARIHATTGSSPW